MRILVVDDEETVADNLRKILLKLGDEVEVAYDVDDAIDSLEANPPDLVLTDWNFSTRSGRLGLEIVKHARHMQPAVESIVFTGQGGIDEAVEAVRQGARDFLTKPVTVRQLKSRVEEVRSELTGASSVPAEVAAPTGSVGYRSAAGAELLTLIERVAPTPSPVWITGEVGSGREHTARLLHERSGREGGFHVLDVARHPERNWPTSGTVLLPHVDLLSEPALAVLASRLPEVPAAVRVLATATDDAPPPHAASSAWSEVYFALRVLVVPVPPLRNRREDVPDLVAAALSRFAGRYDRPTPQLSDDQIAALTARAWPGNLKELNNLAERMVVLGADTVTATPAAGVASGSSAPAPIHPGPALLGPSFKLADYLEQTERRILSEALTACDGDRKQAGELLGVERNTLRYKLRKYGLL